MSISSGRRRPTKLSPKTKWKNLLTDRGEEITEAGAVWKWQVDVSTVITTRTLKTQHWWLCPASPVVLTRPATFELEAAQAEIGQLTEAVKTHAILRTRANWN